MQKNLPKALFIATVMVTVLYTLLNYVFLLLVPIPELAGKVEVKFLVAEQMLDKRNAKQIPVNALFF